MSFSAGQRTAREETTFLILIGLSASHLLNDTIQSLLPSIYPLLKDNHQLSFSQIGLITLVLQLTASLLQPLVGSYTDRRPQPYSLPVGMGLTLTGLILLALAGNYPLILVASALVGIGSSIFHPEASRLARLASGGRHGFAQAIFQVGGNLGSALGPLLAALVIMSRGQIHILWFTLLALAGILVLTRVSRWYSEQLSRLRRTPATATPPAPLPFPPGRTLFILGVLAVLIFSKYFYLACFTSYYTFYLIESFGTTARHAQFLLFLFLFAVAAGTILGGPVGDRFGRKFVIWFSILGVSPFALLLPHAGLMGTIILSSIIGVILASAFSAILVYAQELVPGKVGLVGGLFFGFAFGMAGIGSALLGWMADHTSVAHIFKLCAYLPLIGLLAVFLPNLDRLTRSETAR